MSWMELRVYRKFLWHLVVTVSFLGDSAMLMNAGISANAALVSLRIWFHVGFSCLGF